MPIWHRLKTIWRNLTQKRIVEDDLAQEIRAYQSLLEDEKARAGMDPGAARRQTLLDMEGSEQIKEKVRDVRLGVTTAEVFSLRAEAVLCADSAATKT